jgi:radical SAM superfamily enzyme YgiQ (UPF0313 family)
MKRITLVGTAVQPYPSGSYNLATAYLKACAMSRLDSVDILRLDFPIHIDNPYLDLKVVDEILKNDPEIIGFSCYCWDKDAYPQIFSEVKKKSPSIKIVAGGPSVMFNPDVVFRNNPAVDIIACGEGEETFSDLIGRGMNRVHEIEGIVYRDGDAIRHNPDRAPVDLTKIPSPYLTGAVKPPKWEFMVECSRGCPFKCRYCEWKIFQKGIRYMSMDTFSRELQWGLDNGYLYCPINDASINYNDEMMGRICSTIKSIVPEGAIHFAYFIHWEFFKPSQMKYLYGISTYEIWLSIESTNPAALRTAGRRPLNQEKFLKTIRKISEMQPVIIFIMLGMPGDTFDGFRQTVDFLASNAFHEGRRVISGVYVFWMIITEGSYFSKHRSDYGIRTASCGIPYITGCGSFPSEDLSRAILYLYNHPDRELFRWEDAPPWQYFKNLGNISHEEWTSSMRRQVTTSLKSQKENNPPPISFFTDSDRGKTGAEK